MNCTNHPDVFAGVVACARCGKPFCQDCVILLDGQPYDAVCKEEQIRDLRSGATGLAYATVVRRWAAITLDVLIVYFGMGVLAGIIIPNLVKSGMTAPGAGVIFALELVVPSLLVAIYEGLLGGQTLGKRALGIRVVNEDGTAIAGGTAWKRSLARFVMAITFVMNLVDFILVFSERHRTLRDRFADTVVVRT